jgi:hypothetical protein
MAEKLVTYNARSIYRVTGRIKKIKKKLCKVVSFIKKFYIFALTN